MIYMTHTCAWKLQNEPMEWIKAAWEALEQSVLFVWTLDCQVQYDAIGVDNHSFSYLELLIRDVERCVTSKYKEWGLKEGLLEF